MADNRKAAITAKVAVQCAEFYKKALGYLESSKAASAFGSSQTKVDVTISLRYRNVIVALLESFCIRFRVCVVALCYASLQRWKKHMELKLNFTKCVTYYYLTVQSEEQNKYGERVTYAQAASEKLAECVKLSQVHKSFGVTRPNDCKIFDNVESTLSNRHCCCSFSSTAFPYGNNFGRAQPMISNYHVCHAVFCQSLNNRKYSWENDFWE